MRSAMLVSLFTLVASITTQLATLDARVSVVGGGTFDLQFAIARTGGTSDGVRMVVETAEAGSNPAIPGRDFIPLLPATRVLMHPNQISTTVTVKVTANPIPEADKTLLLRVTEARAFHPHPRLMPAASRFPARGHGPSSMVLADVNHDDEADIVIGNDLSADISILLSRGEGTFADAANYPLTVPPYPFKVLVGVADITGEGHPDLVAAGFSATTLQVFIGDGSGQFGGAVSIPLALTGNERPTALALGDVNEDGDPDIVLTVGLSGQVLVLAGADGSSFAPPKHFPAASGAGDLVLADVNRDGNLDAVTVNENSAGNQISILCGDGAGTFAAPRHLAIDSTVIPRSVVLADVTGSEALDIITANVSSGGRGEGSVAVLSGDGAGAFGVAVLFPMDASDGPAAAVAAGDVTGDRRVDLVVTLPGTNAVALLAGNDAGGFTSATRIPTGLSPSSVDVADINGDGHADVIAKNASGVSILPGDGAGNVGPGGRFGAGRYPHSIVAVDVDGNGHQDLAVANAKSNDVSVLLGDGAGGFADAVDYAVGIAPTSITSGDVNGDSNPDLIAATTMTVSVLLGDGAGHFGEATQRTIGNGTQAAYAVAAGDLDEDGHLDVVTANTNLARPASTAVFNGEGVSVMFGDGTGAFAAPVHYAVGTSLSHDPRSIVLADVTGDGKLDIVTANLITSDLSLLAGDGRGNFAVAMHLPTGAGPVGVAAADVTGDGRRDLIALNHTAQSISVLAATASGGFAPAVHFPISGENHPCEDGVCPWAWGLAVDDITGDGHLDIITANTDSDSVSILPNDGHGSFPTFASFDTGARPGSVTVADVTGDGNLDVITANRQNDDVALLPNQLSRVQLLDGEAVGTITWRPLHRRRSVKH